MSAALVGTSIGMLLLCAIVIVLYSWAPKDVSEGIDLEPFFTEDAKRKNAISNLNTWKRDGVTKLVYVDDGSEYKGLARLIWEKDGFALAELPDGTEYVLLRGEYTHTIYPRKQDRAPEVTNKSVTKQVDELSKLAQEILADDAARDIQWTPAPKPTNPLYVCPVQGCKSQWNWSLAQCSGCGTTLAWILKMQSEGADGELLVRRPSMNKVIKGLK
jgi:hypothetical protein